ncbi:hypothetical protein BJ912DRAFT_974755 [Pholiota molesta]|nr:hypothetical protein BJ912DRAFT_974755 [Pholiota molesta]
MHNNDLYDSISPEDVYATPELANLIIEEAQYWPKISCKFEPDMASPIRIAEIRFRIESHDQGWGGEAGLPGPYDGSYTWFESVIVRGFENEYDNLNDTEQILDILEMRGYMPPAAQLDNVYTWEPVQLLTLKTVKNPNKNSDTWDIQRNRRAFHERQTHVVVWTKEVDKEVDEKATYEATGSSLGIDFVKSLRPGDRIAVLARAQVSI